jgi:hypothetical protein
MVVPTGHPIGGAEFVAAQLNWTYFHLGTWIGGVNAPEGGNFVAIVPFFSDYIVTFDYATSDHQYRWLQYSGPPLHLFLGTYYYGTILVRDLAFGSMFGWAGVPYSMHYYRIKQVGITRVPRSESGYWWFESTGIELPAYLVRDPLIVRYDPYVWLGTEAIVAWATMEEFAEKSFDELMTAKNYIDKELIHLPSSAKIVSSLFHPVLRGYIAGLSGVYVNQFWSGTLWLWAWTREPKPFHLFDDERYQFFDPIIKPGGKVLAAGFLKVGSIGVSATAERHEYPQLGDSLWIRVPFNPAPFEVVKWFDVTAFVVGYFYERRGSYFFEVSYGAVIPPAYIVEYYGSQILFQVWIATNVPSGSFLVHQAVLAYPRRVEFCPQSYSNLLTVLTDWVYSLVNMDRFLLVSDYSDSLVFTPEDFRSGNLSSFTVCLFRHFLPSEGGYFWETEEGWTLTFRYSGVYTYVYDAVYSKRRDGGITFLGCEPLLVVPLSGGLRWLAPVPTEFNPYLLTAARDIWELCFPYHWDLRWDSSTIQLLIRMPIENYTDLPNNRVIDLEKPHRFFYEDVFVLTHPDSTEPPVVMIGSVLHRSGYTVPDFALDIDAPLPFTYRPVFVGSWKIPTPIYNAEGNDPYNILPHFRLIVERRFKDERDVHSNILSDAHLRIRTIVNREFIECLVTKPLTFFEHRTGFPQSLLEPSPHKWAIPILADPRSVESEFDWIHPSIDFWCPDSFASFNVNPGAAIPIVIGRTACSAPVPSEVEEFHLSVSVNPLNPLIAEPHSTYRFVRWFWHSWPLIESIARIFDELVHRIYSAFPPLTIIDCEFQAFGPPFHAVGSRLWRAITLPDKAHPAPAPFISGGGKIVGLGSLYRWAKQESLVAPEWFERYMHRNGEDGEHFLSGKLKATIVYASYWPIEPAYLLVYVWNYRGTNPYKHFSAALDIYGVFNEDLRFGTIKWCPQLGDNYNWRGRIVNDWYNHWFDDTFVSNRARLLFPNRGWVEELPAGRMTRIPDQLEVLALYGTATYLDREAIFVKQVVTLGNTSVLLLPRHAWYDVLGRAVPYFTQDGGKCPLWMGEPIIGVDGIPYDDGRIVVYVYSVRGVYSFVLTPSGVENWKFEPVPKWYWKLLTGQE